ncbi:MULTISPECIES: hypothetical protein [unclassified Acinetobacter]|nr:MULTISPECIES: hypothetical protein [unclassified Acinetobacter]MDH0032952.1 hypothetical protein [Acinetobacter sp. GD04021]MDH0888326.1 hypothetical protein [Acinetobacter sp. GD03873]MDH1084757.1 hypothetical protein [Acinetobacter sp. GD03983]MDH2191647.1 hypothetical protein [Acinetobacter sp. GD03645]MDH2205244.1 hypothetical protein [Acinetobacter sp. GD03647]
MNIWIHARLIQHVEKIIGRRPVRHEEDILEQIKNITSLKEVRQITMINTMKLVHGLSTEWEQEQTFKEILDYMDSKLDIIFDQRLRRFLELIEDDKYLAYFHEIKTNCYLDDEKENIIKQFNEIEKLEDSDSIVDLYNFLPQLPKDLYFNTANIRANKNITLEMAHKELTSISQHHVRLFENTLNTYSNIHKISKNIIKSKLSNKDYIEWLFDYISRKVDIEHIPHTLKEKRSFIISQLNFWYLISPDAYNQVLKRIQSSWNKREFNKRPKSERKKIAKKSELPKEDSEQSKTKLPFKIRRTPV